MVRFFIVIVLVIAALPASAQTTVLESLVKKDLRSLSEKELAPLSKLLNKESDPNSKLFDPITKLFGPSPWYVWPVSKSGRKRFLVFEGQPLLSQPGVSTVRIHLFDASGKRMHQWAFSTGWRIDLDSASISYNQGLAAHVITINTSPAIHGREVAKQHFALVDDRLHFIRMEGPKGQVLDNDYEHPNKTLGNAPKAKSGEDWLRRLQSKNKCEVLAALMFLGGRHLDPPRKEPGYHLEEIEQARMVRKLRSDQKAAQFIRRYMKSDSKWIAEAATLASKTLKSP